MFCDRGNSVRLRTTLPSDSRRFRWATSRFYIRSSDAVVSGWLTLLTDAAAEAGVAQGDRMMDAHMCNGLWSYIKAAFFLYTHVVGYVFLLFA